MWLFLMMPSVCLQFVIVVFPDHTHLLFWKVMVLNLSGYRNDLEMNGVKSIWSGMF